MATYSDSFTNTAGTVLNTHNALWVFVAGDGAAYYGIVGGTTAGTLFTGTSQKNYFRYNNTAADDQYGEFVVDSTGTQFDGGIRALLVLRSSTDASPNNDCYYLETQDNGANGGSHNFLVFKVVNGTHTQIGSTFTNALSNGDTVRFEASGSATTTLVTKVNGTQIDSRTDSSSPHTSGQIGIGGSKPGGMRMASWAGGDLATAPVISSPTATPGSTTASVGVTTDTASGTLYALARVGGSAASAATIKATGQTVSVSSTSPSFTYTGLTASTANYYIDFVQNATSDSNVVSSTSFSTSSASSAIPVISAYYRMMIQ